jgi:HEAT repeats
LMSTGKIGATNARQSLDVESKLLNDENNAVRMAAGSALSMSRDSGARELILQRLRVETNPDVRESLLKDSATKTTPE